MDLKKAPAKINLNGGAAVATKAADTSPAIVFSAFQKLMMELKRAAVDPAGFIKQVIDLAKQYDSLGVDKLQVSYDSAVASVYSSDQSKFPFNGVGLGEMLANPDATAKLTEGGSTVSLDAGSDANEVKAEAVEKESVKSADQPQTAAASVVEAAGADASGGSEPSLEELLAGVVNEGAGVIPKEQSQQSIEGELISEESFSEEKLSAILLKLTKLKAGEDSSQLMAELSKLAESCTPEELARLEERCMNAFQENSKLAAQFGEMYAQLNGSKLEKPQHDFADKAAKASLEQKPDGDKVKGPLVNKDELLERFNDVAPKAGAKQSGEPGGFALNINAEGLGDVVAKTSAAAGGFVKSLLGMGKRSGGALKSALASGAVLAKDKRDQRLASNSVKQFADAASSVSAISSQIEEKTKYLTERLERMGCSADDLKGCTQKVVDCINHNPDLRMAAQDLTLDVQELGDRVKDAGMYAEEMKLNGLNAEQGAKFAADSRVIKSAVDAASKSAGKFPVAKDDVDVNNLDADLVSKDKRHDEELSKMQALMKKLAEIIERILAMFKVGAAKEAAPEMKAG